MLTSMYTAVSGMNASGTSLSVIGDNIANMNTVGYKSSDITFGDILSQSITSGGSSSQVGRGVDVTSVTPVFSQGSFESTTNALDLAIDGDGFFIVQNNVGTEYYSRAGQFSIDKNGNIVDPNGMSLQGYVVDAAGNVSGTVASMQVATQQSPANPSTTFNISVNLDGAATTYDQTSGATTRFTLNANGDGKINDPANYDFSNSTTIYDSLGGAHAVTLYYCKTAVANTWDVHYVIEDPSNPGQLMEAGQTSGGVGNIPSGQPIWQELSFNTDGSLQQDTVSYTFDTNGTTILKGQTNDPTNTGTYYAIQFNFGGGVVQGQKISFNFGTSIAESGTGLDMSTQYSGSSSVMQVTSDGYGAGSLKSVNISDDGTITGIFTNGQTRSVGMVALARFVSTTSLTKVGNNLYAESYDSGQPVVGQANTSGLGKVLANTLELSNVDLATEFVKMISSQRGYQANSRVITTSDALMQETVNLVR